MAGAEVGGAETYYVDMVTALARAGLSQTAVIRSEPRRAAQLRQAGVETVELAFGRLLDFSTKAALRRHFAAIRPTIVQTWMSRATQFCPSGDFLHVGWLGGYYKPATFRRCDHTVAVTTDIVQHLRDGGLPADRTHYIPTFAVHREVPPVSRASLHTPDGVPLLLALGRLHPKKGFDVLLRALAQVERAWLWLAGEGELRAELEALAMSAGVADRVRFLGWRTDREALLAACDVCVMPSRYEPFGTVMIEAWAANRPLVVAAAAGPKGLVRDGVDALLVPIDDVGALADALRRTVSDRGLASTLAQNGHRAYVERFTEQAVVRQYLQFYESIGR
jgi:glycosyltransferase involved in cell wall biosynthesis